MSKHVLHFYCGVTPKSCSDLRTAILQILNDKNSSNEIEIRMSSRGGSLDEGFTTYNFLRSLDVPLSIINTGSVNSSAVLIFLGVDVRLADEASCFLLHGFDWTFNGSTPFHLLREATSSLEADSRRYASIFENRTNGAELRIDIMQHLAGDARVLTATEAMSAGIVTSSGASERRITPADAHWWFSA